MIKSSTPQLNLPKAISEERFLREAEKYDVIVFNQGLHYMIGPLQEVVVHFKLVGEMLGKLVQDSSKQV